MKKYLLNFAVLMMATALFTACGDDDDDPAPQPKPVNVSEGMFVVGSGNSKSNIDGNLTYIDYANGTSTTNAFQKANGMSLGKTANFALVYGQKLYIAVDGENTIWVCDKNTLRSIRRINTTQLLGDINGISPRSLASYEGQLFFACYSDKAHGTVAAVDTVNFNLVKTYAAGSYSDGIAIANDKLYVANSDYGNGINPSITVHDLKTGAASELKGADVTNPMQMMTVGGNAYFLDYGTYDASWNQTGAGVRQISADGTVKRVVDGTAMGSDGKRIFTVNAPYGSGSINYLIYDTTTGQTTSWEPSDIYSPAAIAADPVTGDIFVISYNENPDTHYPGYNLPSYVNQYSADGTFKKRYDCGVGPISVVFNTGVKYE
ncbi:MAG: hypothetical protein IKX36_11510 [Prevotella sp.]|nr:hypothetical protein [Prevotella sp.]